MTNLDVCSVFLGGSANNGTVGYQRSKINEHTLSIILFVVFHSEYGSVTKVQMAPLKNSTLNTTPVGFVKFPVL